MARGPNKVKEIIFEILNEQMRTNNPPETKETYYRLLGMGISKEEVKRMIANCISVEIFHLLKSKEPFNQERYKENLKRLPVEPGEEE